MKQTETSVQVIADSIRWDCWKFSQTQRIERVGYHDTPGRILTLQMRYPRWIHSEFMTHRDRARNAASSRAVSVKKSLDNNKFRPMDIPSEQKGMSGGDTLSLDHKRAAYGIIEQMAQFSETSARALVALGVHKSIVNRYLEPFAYIDVVCTATRWDHFLSLRDHCEAEPHFRELARMVRNSLDGSVPVPTDFHLPYVDRGEVANYDPDKCLRVSAARCAGISYQRPDFTVDKELEVCEKLVGNRHSSPLEHPNTSKDVPTDFRSGPMVGWKSLRTVLGQD